MIAREKATEKAVTTRWGTWQANDSREPQAHVQGIGRIYHDFCSAGIVVLYNVNQECTIPPTL
jgi:hypothetical protein